ncbi:MAG: prepilin peptidase [Chloroflexota bacterium]|nr:prepilin peptidase [Chloroflexota bacterium]
MILTIVLTAAAGWAAYTDIRRRRISNRLTFGVALLALALHLLFGGPAGLLVGLEGWLAGVALLAVPFALGWMGAGDVKLLAVFGALGGPEFVIRTALLGGIAGGVVAVFFLAREGRLWPVLRFLPVYIRHPLGSLTPRRMPFGPALAVGAAASVVLMRGVM